MNDLHDLKPNDWDLQKDAFGKLTFISASNQRFAGVVPIRAFPIQ